MNNIKNTDTKEINLNKVHISEKPTRVCYVISEETKERLAKHVRSSTVLTASIMVDLALNLLLEDLESGAARLVVTTNMDKE